MPTTPNLVWPARDRRAAESAAIVRELAERGKTLGDFEAYLRGLSAHPRVGDPGAERTRETEIALGLGRPGERVAGPRWPRPMDYHAAAHEPGAMRAEERANERAQRRERG